jgi:uncharacterized membrane protein
MPKEKGAGKEYSRNHIPKQALGQSNTLIKRGQTEPRMAGQEKPRVIIRQTPVPEVRIYGQTTPRKYNLGMKASDTLTKWGGSWHFIGGFFLFLVIWMLVNLYMIANIWDPYPFILLNLVLSCLAAIQAPVILMSQNRAADRDRTKAERDYAINRKSEREVEQIKKDLEHIKKKLAEISARLR